MAADRCVPIVSDDDLVAVRAAGRALALELGFARADATLIATAISEIARNIIVHAGRGEMVLRSVTEGAREGLSVVAADDGPGIRDVDAALQDGWATRGGLGLGLPGARRLMDEFQVDSKLGRGTTVTMTKWRDPSSVPQGRNSGRLDADHSNAAEWAIAARPKPGQTASGADALATATDDGVLLAVVDGLGQAPGAAHATSIAVQTIVRHASAGLVPIMTACHHALAETRGVAMSVATVSATHRILAWLAVGNVCGTLSTGLPTVPLRHVALPLHEGIVGHRRLPPLELTTFEIEPGNVLIVTTDGVPRDVDEPPTLTGSTAGIAAELLAQSRTHDDGLVLVLRYLSANR